MARVFNSSVDCVILVDHLMKKLVELCEAWGKKHGQPLYVRHKEKEMAMVRQLQSKYVDSLSLSKITNYTHSDNDEKAIFELAQFVSHKSAELREFSSPLSPLVWGETFIPELLRSKEPMTTQFLEDAINAYGQMMEDGVDPVEKSLTHDILLKAEPGQRSILVDSDE